MTLPLRAYDVAVAASANAQQTGSLAAWSVAVEKWIQVFQTPGVQAHPLTLMDTRVQLGNAFDARYVAGGGIDDLTAAVTCLVAALEMPECGPIRDSVSADLALAALHLFEETGRLSDLDLAIAAYQQAAEGGQLDRETSDIIRNNYGLALYKRHQAAGDPAALDEAVECLGRQARSAGSPQSRADAAANLGIALRARFEFGHDPADLDNSVAAQRAAVATGTPGSESWARWMSNLGNALNNRFQLRGDRQDLLDAVSAQRQALRALPPGSPAWTNAQVNLGSALGLLADRFGDTADLEAGITAYRAAAARAPRGSTAWLVATNGLVGLLKNRFQAAADPTDLDAAAELGQQLLAELPTGSRQRVPALIQVGLVQRTRYAGTAAPADIELALDCLREAVRTADAQHRATAIGALGETLITRYHITGDYADLDAAIESLRDALAVVADGSAGAGDLAATLSGALDLRYADSFDLTAVEESLALRRQALATVGAGTAKWVRWHGDLAATLSLRHRITNDTGDLTAAVDALRAALDVPQPRSLSWVAAQLELAGTLMQRHQATGHSSDDLAAAVAAASAAEQAPHLPPAELVWQQLTLGDAHRLRFGESAEPADATAATRCYTAILGRDGVSAERTAIAAAGLGELLSLQDDWAGAAEALERAMRSFDELYETQLTLAHRDSALARIAHAGLLAGYALAQAGRPGDAVALLERSRARALGGVLGRDRAELDRLWQDHPEIFRQYTGSVRELDRIEALERSGGDPGDRARQARDSHRRAVTAVRAVPGYERFLVAPTWADIAGWLAGAGGPPVVYLISTRDGGVALLLTPAAQPAAAQPAAAQPAAAQPEAAQPAVEAVWLDQLDAVTVRDLLIGPDGWTAAYAGWIDDPGKGRDRWFDALESTGRELWRRAMGPLLDLLRERGTTAATLIPGGLLALFPWHAAQVEDPDAPTGIRCALDDLVLSYAPSIRVATIARRGVPGASGGTLLAVAEPAPVTASPLPAAAIEVAAVAGMFADPVVLTGTEATREAVLDRLPGSGVVHLSCHGRTDWAAPLRSGLLLAGDQWLSVGDLLDRRLPPARLACLSACETGAIGLSLPDESVSLPTALLQAGFAGIVASLWTVSDVATAMLMERFHTLWHELGDPAAALRQAQRWLRDTTNGEKAAYFHQQLPGLDASRASGSAAAEFFTVTVIRRGDARDFAHPFWWAAFALTGA
ncbi:CHAT domain-containing protein [Actinoplanes subtropicus]|uniref:CHAT domain-containing protein n=1 Tax=Actinoplanes subtropicus TaxID=543632 RepID=UPI0004C45FD1|nr:CHAT domain-containing protein [Actinoplanes subtropicus]